MTKKKIYLVSILLLIVAGAGIVYGYYRKQKTEEQTVYTLLPRKGAAAQTAEWKEVQQKAAQLMIRVKEHPEDNKATLQLAALYIQEARETGNHMYYDKAALKHVTKVLTVEPENFHALVFKSLIFMSQHHFAEGLATAHQARQLNPDNAYIHGLLVDGYVEMGMYDSAVIYGDKMVAKRPDLTSYSRISYLREIHGDYKGAIDAMKMAVEAGGRGDEHTEWTRVQLAQLYEKTGDYNSAEQLYDMSLTLRPDYPYALAGMARLALASKAYDKAIKLYEQANAIVDDNSIKEELAEAYQSAGKEDKAKATVQELISGLQVDTEQENEDESIGHYSDRELAYAYLKKGNTGDALKHALLEYNRRPKNIDVNETVAWVYYTKGEYKKAFPYIKEAMRTNSKNPVLLSRAGLIYLKAGDKQLAKTTLSEAMVSNVYLEPSLRAEITAAMQQM